MTHWLSTDQLEIFSICISHVWAKLTKNFDHSLICVSVTPSSRQKLWAPLATIFVEKKIWKKFWWGFRHIWVTPWKEFLISWKKWRFEIFRTALPSRASVVHAWGYWSWWGFIWIWDADEDASKLLGFEFHLTNHIIIFSRCNWSRSWGRCVPWIFHWNQNK